MNDPYLTNLAEQISRGSHKAFDEVFRQYYGRVSNFIRSLIKSQSVAEDIVQDVFVNLWNSRHALSEVRSLNSYIYTIARNAAIDHMRRIHTYNVPLELSDEPQGELTDEQYFAIEKELMIKMAVENFPERRRQIFSMSRFEGLSNDEIAKRLGISKKTVENHINLATHDLQKIIGAIVLFMLVR